MRYSLVVVTREEDGIVDGVWVQFCTAVTLEQAAQKARSTEAANSYSQTIAVVEDLGYSCPNYAHRTGLKRLD